MIYDIHVHQKEHSFDSKLNIEDALIQAKKISLDGICITDHDSLGLRKDKNRIDNLISKYGVNIIVGVEIFTLDGDLLCYGIDELPKSRLSAKETIKFVNDLGGICIAAHPYRNATRGLEDNIVFLDNLHGVEAFNGRTSNSLNIKAFQIANKKNSTILGGSDAHSINEIGNFATKFEVEIKNESDFILAIKEGKTQVISLTNN